MMKVLLAAQHPPGGRLKYGGVQSWISTIARRFSFLGLDVTVWGPEYPLPAERFDLGVFANTKFTGSATILCDRIIEFSHGIVSAEQPSGQHRTAYTSEEVARHWRRPGTIIRQPIDVSMWHPSGYRGEDAGVVLYSYRCVDTVPFKALASELGMSFTHLKGVDPEAARKGLVGAALVCASGRAALEAMSCDVPTMIFDWRPYNGRALYKQCIDIARRYNYSGRGPIEKSPQTALQVAKSVIEAGGRRDYVIEWHEASKVAGEILDACSIDPDRSSPTSI